MIAAVQNLDFSIVNTLSTYTVTHTWASVLVYVCAEMLIAVPFLTLALMWFQPGRFTTYRPIRKAVVMTIMALTVALALKSLIAFLISRDRPFISHPDMLYLPFKVDSSSFPSGHTILAFTMAFSLLWSKFQRTGTTFLLIACIVAFARVAAGVHYPTDILGGIVVAFIATWFVFREASGVREYLPNK